MKNRRHTNWHVGIIRTLSPLPLGITRKSSCSRRLPVRSRPTVNTPKRIRLGCCLSGEVEDSFSALTISANCSRWLIGRPSSMLAFMQKWDSNWSSCVPC